MSLTISQFMRRALIAALCLLGTSSLCAAKDIDRQPRTPNPSVVQNGQNDSVETKRSHGNDKDIPEFRYWKIPAKSIDRAPWGPEKYFPIKVETFNEWLFSIEESKRLQAEDSQALYDAIPSLFLSAKSEGVSLVGGGVFKTYDVDLSSVEAQDVSSTRYRVQPFSFALSFAGDDNNELSQRLGVYADGRLYLPNTVPGERSFHWTQRGKLDKDGSVVYDLEFPNTVRSELTLETPADSVVRSSVGVVQRLDESESNAAARWRVYFGGRCSARLTISSADASSMSENHRKVSVRQDSSYRLTREGLELVSRFEFERGDVRANEISLRLAAPLRVTSLEWGSVKDEQLDTSVTSDEEGIVVTARAPAEKEPLDDLRLTAFCPIVLDDYFTLPTAAVENDAFVWKESTLRLSIERPLVTSFAFPENAIQARETYRGRQAATERMCFKALDPRGSVTLKMRYLQNSPRFDSVTDCLFLPNEITAKTTLLFNFTDGADTRVTIPFASGWNLDAVLSGSDEPVSWILENAEVVEDRAATDDPSDEQTPSEQVANEPVENGDNGSEPSNSGPRQLSISFKKKPASNQPVRVVLSARRHKEVDASIDVDQLCPVDLSNNLYGVHALTLHSEGSRQARVTTRLGRTFQPSKPSLNYIFSENALKEASPVPAGALRLYFGAQTADAVASLEAIDSPYTTTASCVCELYQDVFYSRQAVEKWNLRCVPVNGARVDRVVFFTKAQERGTVDYDAPWKWGYAGDNTRKYRVYKLSNSERSALKVPEEMDAYEVRLPDAKTAAFDLELEYSFRGSGQFEAPLIFLPESTNTSFEVVVRSPQGWPFWTRAEGLYDSTAPLADPDEYESLKKAFRYDPTPAKGGEPYPCLNVYLDYPMDDDFAERKDGSEEEQAGLDENAETPIAVLPSAAWCWQLNIDSYYESNGQARNRASFWIENHGRSSVFLKLPPNASKNTVRDVIVDGSRAVWDYDEDERALEIVLPVDRRFVTVVVEYQTRGSNLAGGRRLEPSAMICDLPVLSSVWNAWTPPQYQTCREFSDWFNEPVHGVWLGDIFSKFAVGTTRGAIRNSAYRFAQRLGNRTLLKNIVAASKQVAAEKNNNTTGANAASALNGALTLGDVFGSREVVQALFAVSVLRDPEIAAAEKNVGNTTPSVNEIAAVLKNSNAGTFELYIDRLALSTSGLSMKTILPENDEKDVYNVAAHALNEAGVALVFLDKNVALLSTVEELSFVNYLRVAPVIGSSILRRYRAEDAEKLLDLVKIRNNSRYVTPENWDNSDVPIAPWTKFAMSEVLPGWNLTSLPLNRRDAGVHVVNRYFLWALELSCFIGFVVFAWKLNLVNPRFCLGVVGVCVALLNVVFLEWVSVVRGLMWGALTVFAFSFVFRRFQRRGAATIKIAKEPRVKVKKTKKEKIVKPLEAAPADDGSTEGFVDFNKMPPEERMLFKTDSQTNVEDASKRGGSVSLTAILALAALAALALAMASSARADIGSAPSGSVSQNGVSTNNAEKKAADKTVSEGASANERGAVEQKNEWTEPSRVFVPVDESNQAVGGYYWVGTELYESIRDVLKDRPRERNWRVVDASYDGGVNYNALTGVTELFNLKATYKIVLDSTKAVITFPATPLVPDVGARFDRETIAPSYDEQRNELLFEIDGVAPGLHTLELTIVSPQFSEASNELSFPIIPCPSARLSLSVPADAPLLDAPSARGRVSRSPGLFAAELGYTDKLTLRKQESGTSSASFDVEQLFLIRPRAAQLDVRSIFHYQTASDEKIKALDVECDPLYAFSGYCQCAEAEIEIVEPPTEQNNAVHIVFKEPIGGTFTLNINFMARNFSGVGRLAFPRITTRNARSVKSWIATSTRGDGKCVDMPATTVTNAAFLKAWGDPEESIDAAYDLAILSRDSTFSTRLSTETPVVDVVTTVVFGPAETKIACEAAVRSESDLFRLALDAPRPFAVDKVELFNAQGEPLESPEYFLTDDALTIVFASPIKGTAKLRVVGRGKTRVDEKRPLPSFHFFDAISGKRYARIYCDPSVYVDWVRPRNWRAMERSAAAGLCPEPEGEYRYVDSCEIGALGEEALDGYFSALVPETPEGTEKIDEEEVEAVASVRMNEPTYVGTERSTLYKTAGDAKTWRALVEFKFDVENGSVDRYYIAADEGFTWNVENPDGNFDAIETTTPSGVRAILVKPKKTILGQVEIQLNAEYVNEPETIRLPKFQLLPGSAREDVSAIKRRVLLPLRQQGEQLRWTTQDMEPAPREPDEDWSPADFTQGVASMLLNGSVGKVDSDDRSSIYIAKASGMSSEDFAAFIRGGSAAATLDSERDDFAVSVASHVFYINANREFFGAATFTIRQVSHRSAVLVVPPQYLVLEATVNGSRRLVEQISQDRWRVDLGSTPYIKRLEVTFEGLSLDGSQISPALRTNSSPTFGVDLIHIEGTVPERTLWVCAFEPRGIGDSNWRVFQYAAGDDPLRAPTKNERQKSERTPVRLADANELLFRWGVNASATLLECYENDLARLTGEYRDDLPRMKAWWDMTWKDSETEMRRLASANPVPDLLTERQKDALFVVEKDNTVAAPERMNDAISRWSAARYRDILEQKRKLDDVYKSSENYVVPEVDYISPKDIWSYEVGRSTNMLFGISYSNPGRLYISSTPKSINFLSTHYATAVFFLVLTTVFLHLLKKDPACGIKAFTSGALVAGWGAIFLALGSRVVGLFGALAIAIGPILFSKIWETARRGNNNDKNSSDDDKSVPVVESSSQEIHEKREETELDTTESYTPKAEQEASTNDSGDIPDPDYGVVEKKDDSQDSRVEEYFD